MVLREQGDSDHRKKGVTAGKMMKGGWLGMDKLCPLRTAVKTGKQSANDKILLKGKKKVREGKNQRKY